MKPACSLCVSHFDKCVYSASTSTSSIRPVTRPSSEGSSHTASPMNRMYSCSPASFEDSRSPMSSIGSELDLYQHYINHTACSLSPCHEDRGNLQTKMVDLAMQSEAIYQALLACAAACWCCDMSVHLLLRTGMRPGPGARGTIGAGCRSCSWRVWASFGDFCSHIPPPSPLTTYRSAALRMQSRPR